MQRKHFIQLIDKYLAQKATPAEQRLLEEYYTHLAAKGPADLQEEEDENILIKEVLEKITAQEQPGRGHVIPMRTRRWAWIAAVFAGVLLCAGGWSLLHYRGGNRGTVAKAPAALQDDIAPGGNKAILTLGDGTRIELDTARNGTVTAQGSMQITKSEDGQLAYNAGSRARDASTTGADPHAGDADGGIVYNSLTTPRGGQYRITLSDGSRVWLNAASSIRYPSVFASKERTVEITGGEAYFEVEKDPVRPFIVKVSDAQVQVLGTHFNIMAYSDEAELKTTLLEGAVKVWKGGASLLLGPGQQASLPAGGGIKLVRDADADEVLAWKNNLFSFDNDDIQTVMRQIARWYAVDVKYEGTVTQHFSGNISRGVNVSKLFKMLELTGSVHFKIEGNRIVVGP